MPDATSRFTDPVQSIPITAVEAAAKAAGVAPGKLPDFKAGWLAGQKGVKPTAGDDAAFMAGRQAQARYATK